MSKFIVMIILIFSLSSGNSIVDINESNIKSECKDLYIDYIFFKEKADNSNKKKDGLKERWTNIYKDYKAKLKICQSQAELYLYNEEAFEVEVPQSPQVPNLHNQFYKQNIYQKSY